MLCKELENEVITKFLFLGVFQGQGKLMKFYFNFCQRFDKVWILQNLSGPKNYN